MPKTKPVSLLLLLLLLGTTVRKSHSDFIEGFSFRARFFNPSKSSTASTLRKGHILKPILTQASDTIFQNVILCGDLQLEFDARGISNEVEVVGFCSGPGQAVPTQDVRWTASGYINTIIRDYGCSRRTIERVRREQMLANPAMTQEKPLKTCSGDEDQCLKKFSSWLSLIHEISFREADENGICDRELSRNDKEIVYQLFCDEGRLATYRSRKE